MPDKKNKTYTILGLMSGSSLDGLDMALCSFEFLETDGHPLVLKNWSLQKAETAPFSASWQERLRVLPQQSAFELAKCDVDFGHYIGQLVAGFLKKIPQPDAIASHGHTIFHFPDQHFTTQIGDGASIAAETGCTVINDFRSSDLAKGGQGAPLAPLADQWLLHGHDFYLNLGGIVNISCNTGSRFVAFDIGGANQILNALVQPLGMEYDKDGALAAKGKINPALLDQSRQLDFFKQPYPKSLGNDWVLANQVRAFLSFDCPLEDKLHTACILIGQQVADAIQQIIKKEKIQKNTFTLLASGGGAFNNFLIQCIQQATQKTANITINIPAPDIISFKEACLMALMGALRLENQTNCLATVTGATTNTVGGAIYNSPSPNN